MGTFGTFKSVCQCVGTLVRWRVGASVYWRIDALLWHVGVLACCVGMAGWCVGVLVHVDMWHNWGIGAWVHLYGSISGQKGPGAEEKMLDCWIWVKCYWIGSSGKRHTYGMSPVTMPGTTELTMIWPRTMSHVTSAEPMIERVQYSLMKHVATNHRVDHNESVRSLCGCSMGDQVRHLDSEQMQSTYEVEHLNIDISIAVGGSLGWTDPSLQKARYFLRMGLEVSVVSVVFRGFMRLGRVAQQAVIRCIPDVWETSNLMHLASKLPSQAWYIHLSSGHLSALGTGQIDRRASSNSLDLNQYNINSSCHRAGFLAAHRIHRILIAPPIGASVVLSSSALSAYFSLLHTVIPPHPFTILHHIL